MTNNEHSAIRQLSDIVQITELKRCNKIYQKALQSIAANTCCDTCQEAALVAQAALKKSDAKEIL